jgi:hypothetical protein
MEQYKNLSGSSPVSAFKAHAKRIVISFQNGESYEYTYGSAGKQHIETMKLLAQAGWGLGSYLEQRAKDGYSRQLQ